MFRLYSRCILFCESGFTLLELLVVITLLSVLAGATLIAFDGIEDQGRYDAVKSEMQQIRMALRQFRRDSGTNSFPTQGQYDCTDQFNGGVDTARNSLMVFPAEAGANDVDIIEWCQHPANFWMLFQDPFGTGWNPDTKRGWNGPYLQRKSGYVDVSENIAPDGTGNLITGTVVSNLWGIASPFESATFGANNYFSWRPSVGSDTYDTYGTPYFMFDLDSPNDANPARIVSLNADHEYNGDDDCEQDIATTGLPHDSILCLLQ